MPSQPKEPMDLQSGEKKLLLIDGNNLFHRAYHALPPLNSKDGQNSNAVFGFSNMLIKATGEVKPDYIACAFDTKAPTFRHVEFEKYKAQRTAPPPDLYPQLPKVKSVLDAYGIKYFEKAGYEADDLLASVAIQNAKEVDFVTILSGDRDLLQLVDGKIKVQAPGWNLKETTLYGSVEVKEKYGVSPLQMIDWKALTGDPSDNIPGIAGIGPKTASDLIQKYSSVEGIFEHLDEIGEKVRSKLELGRENAFVAKKLVKLDTEIDLNCELEDLKFEPDIQKVILEFEKLGFKSIVSKLRGSNVTEGSNSTVDNEKTTSDQLELI